MHSDTNNMNIHEKISTHTCVQYTNRRSANLADFFTESCNFQRLCCAEHYCYGNRVAELPMGKQQWVGRESISAASMSVVTAGWHSLLLMLTADVKTFWHTKLLYALTTLII